MNIINKLVDGAIQAETDKILYATECERIRNNRRQNRDRPHVKIDDYLVDKLSK